MMWIRNAAGCGVLGSSLLLSACSGSAGATLPTRATPPPISHRAVAASAPVAPSTPSEAPPLISHAYRKVFGDWGTLLFRGERPWVFSSRGAVDLASGRVLFEGQFGNWAVYEGDSLWFADGFSPMSACPVRSALVQLVGDKWVPRRELNVHDLQVSAWLPGSTLAAITPRRLGPPWGYELVVLEFNRPAPVPQRAGKGRQDGCHTRLSRVQTMTAFASGELFVFGDECPLLPEEALNEQSETAVEESEWRPSVAVESWSRGASKSRFSVLPLRELSRLFAIGPENIWAFGAITKTEWGFAHYDGTRWQLWPERFDRELDSPVPPQTEADSAAKTWVLREGRLLELQQGKTQVHQLPAGCAAVSMEHRGQQLWISCDDGAIHTTDSSIQPFEFPSEQSEEAGVRWTRTLLPKLDPKAPRAGCGEERVNPEPWSTGEVGQKPGSTKPGRSRPQVTLPRSSSKKGASSKQGDFGF